MGLSDGRMPRQLSKDEMVEVVREFIGKILIRHRYVASIHKLMAFILSHMTV